MTKPISRKMAVDCFLYRIMQDDGTTLLEDCLTSAFVCSICDDGILPGQNIQFDHIHADVFDGPHDYRNLRPVHADCHKSKTAQDIKANAKVKRLANPKPSKHPMKSSGRPLTSRPFHKIKGHGFKKRTIPTL